MLKKQTKITNSIIEQLNEQKPKSAAEIYDANDKLLLQHKKESLQEISSELVEKHKDPYTLGQKIQQDLAEYEMKLKDDAAKAILDNAVTIDIESGNSVQDIEQYGASDTFVEFTDFNMTCPLEPIAA